MLAIITIFHPCGFFILFWTATILVATRGHDGRAPLKMFALHLASYLETLNECINPHLPFFTVRRHLADNVIGQL